MRTLRAFTCARRLQSSLPITPRGAVQQGKEVFLQRFTHATAAMPTTALEELAPDKPSSSGLGSSKPWKGFFERNFRKKSSEIELFDVAFGEMCGPRDEMHGICDKFAPLEWSMSAEAVCLRFRRTTTVIPNELSPLWSCVPGPAARGTQ